MIVAIYPASAPRIRAAECSFTSFVDTRKPRGFQVFAEYVDTGFSGAASSRPQLDRLLHDAAASVRGGASLET